MNIKIASYMVDYYKVIAVAKVNDLHDYFAYCIVLVIYFIHLNISAYSDSNVSYDFCIINL